MKKALSRTLLPVAALLLGVAGCDDGYSNLVVYALRTDPIKAGKVPLDPILPDRPGQLPLLSMNDVNHEHNPFYQENIKKNFLDNRIFIDPTLATNKDRDEIRVALDKLFGTPAEPKVGNMSEADRKLLNLTEGTKGTLVMGSKLYRIHCLHCHGVTGDGRGPTARWVNPHPRDYRQGRFKFQSTDATKDIRKPHRDDLLRVLEIGIEATAMPSFVLLPKEEREALVSYVIHLSLRGQTEFEVFKRFQYDKKTNKLVYSDEDTLTELVNKFYKNNVDKWLQAQNSEYQIPIPVYPYDADDKEMFAESVKRGREIFTNPPKRYNVGNNACLTCHIDYGRRSTFKEDDWGTFAKPNNLLTGIFRGGRRPIDIYRRIHSGIDPSGMSIAFGALFPTGTSLNILIVRDSAAAPQVKELIAKISDAMKLKGHKIQVFTPSDQNVTSLNLDEFKLDTTKPFVVFQDGSNKKIRDAMPLPTTERDFVKTVAGVTDAIWDLVNFVQVLGNPTMRRSMGIYVD